MVRRLTESETSAFLARHPEVVTLRDQGRIPSYGLHISEYGKDFLVGANAAGLIAVWDSTAYDSRGTRIDPAILDKSTLQLALESFYEGIKETVPQIPAEMLKLVKWFAFGIGAVMVWHVLSERRAAKR